MFVHAITRGLGTVPLQTTEGADERRLASSSLRKQQSASGAFLDRAKFCSLARLQLGWALFLNRTQPHADISVVEKAATVLGIATEKEERDAYELITKTKGYTRSFVSSILAAVGNGAAPLLGISLSSTIQNEASPVAGMFYPPSQELHHW